MQVSDVDTSAIEENAQHLILVANSLKRIEKKKNFKKKTYERIILQENSYTDIVENDNKIETCNMVPSIR